MTSDSILDDSGGTRAADSIRTRASWGLKDIGLVIALGVSTILLYEVLLYAPAESISGKHSGLANLAVAVVGIIWDLTLVGLVFWRVRRHGGSTASLGLRRPWPAPQTPFRRIGWRGPWTYGKLAAWAVGAYILSNITVQVYVALMKLVGADGLLPDQQLPEEAFDHWWVVITLGIAVIIAAPFAEEICFRGFAYAGLRRRFGVLVAALISGFLFSLAHGQPGLIVPFALIGAYFAYTYEITGTIYASMSIHFIFNALSFLVLVFVPDARSS